jgi:hypothetical protein
MQAFTKQTQDRMQMIIDSSDKVRERFMTTSAYYGEDGLFVCLLSVF